MNEPFLPVPKRTSLFEGHGAQIALIVVSLLVIGVGVGLQLAVVVSNYRLANDARFCVEARGPYNAALVTGEIRLQSGHLSYRLQHAGLSSNISGIKIMGRVVPGATTSTDTAVTLCGAGGPAPGCPACDTTSAQLTGAFDQRCNTATSLDSIIAAIREAPSAFYLKVDTGIHGSEVTDYLTRTCGWPV